MSNSSYTCFVELLDDTLANIEFKYKVRLFSELFVFGEKV